ncbi:MAG: hypothetical protein LQ344_006465 [Seirophora lacunosa]|nr:MAG: hypothetical protein LQ344_006465 [Seirophora lacunosa]
MSSESTSTAAIAPNQQGNANTIASNQQGNANTIAPDQQVKFFVSCIRNSNNGKVSHQCLPPSSSHRFSVTHTAQVDFAEVAKECNIISGGAAAKRYQRILRAANLGRKLPLARTRLHKPAIEAKTNSEKSDSGTAAAAHKKRKMAEADTSASEDKDQDYGPTPTKKQATEKEHHDKSPVQEEAADIPQSDGAYDMVPMVKGGKSFLSADKTVPSVYDLDAIYDTIVVAANKEVGRFPGRVLHH